MSETPAPRKKRGWITNSLLVLGSIVFAVLVGEILLRLFAAPPVPTIPHSIYHHTRPDAGNFRWASSQDEFDVRVSFNSLAFRGEEPDLNRERLWVVMGDSMVEAMQVEEEETFCSLLEKKLGPDYTLLNAGVGGYSPVLILLRFTDLLNRIDPKVPERLIVCLFPNDLEEEFLYRSMAYKDLEGEVIAVTPGVLRGRVGKLRTRLFEYSRFWRLAQKAIIPNEEERVQKIDPFFPSDRILYPFRAKWTDAERLVWGDFFRSLGNLGLLCERKGIELTLIIIPPGHQVDREAWKSGKQTMGFRPDGMVESTTFQDEITARGRRIGLEVLDLLPAFKEHPNPKELYFDYDGHWTVEGNRFAADMVFEMIISEGVDEETR